MSSGLGVYASMLCFMLPINISRAYSICLDSLSKFKCKSNRANWALWAAWCAEDLRTALWQAIHIYFAEFCTALHNLQGDVRAEALKMPPDAAKYAQSQMTLSTLLYVCPCPAAVSLRPIAPQRVQQEVDEAERDRERERWSKIMPLKPEVTMLRLIKKEA